MLFSFVSIPNFLIFQRVERSGNRVEKLPKFHAYKHYYNFLLSLNKRNVSSSKWHVSFSAVGICTVNPLLIKCLHWSYCSWNAEVSQMWLQHMEKIIIIIFILINNSVYQLYRYIYTEYFIYTVTKISVSLIGRVVEVWNLT